MPKPEKSLEDLDAELAALEAELAALERGELPAPKAKEKKEKPAKKSRFGLGGKKADAPAPEPAAAPEPPAAPEPTPEPEPSSGPLAAAAPDAAPPAKRSRLLGKLPALRRPKEKDAPEPAPAVAATPVVAAPAPAPVTVPMADTSGRWERADGAWRRVQEVPRKVYRRVLDPDGNVVEEVLVDEAEAADAGAVTQRKRFDFLQRMRKG